MESLTIISILVVLFQFGYGQQRNVFITMSKGTDSVIKSINGQTFSSRAEKAGALKAALQQNAAQSQGPLLKFLHTQSIFTGIKYDSFWINNAVFVKGMPSGVLTSVNQLFGGQIASIADETYATFDSEIVEHEPKQGGTMTWGLNAINVTGAWKIGGNTGEGVIVAGIDTGVRGTHESLRGNYAGGNAWLDPTGKHKTPFDENGHGTHTMGTMVGTGGVGVAPGAKWIACIGCPEGRCPQSALTKCGEWIICPTDVNGKNQDCSKTPSVVNNSWGGSIQNNDYLDIIKAWLAIDIVPIFANGNSGNELWIATCRTTGSPAHLAEAIGVGSTKQDNTLSGFSSRGPVSYDCFFIFCKERIKPNLSAPGSEVNAPWHTSDTAYKSISGTSMAAPHAAGVAALMKATNGQMTAEQIRKGLIDGATTDKLKPPRTSCSNKKGYPNNDFGSGLLNAPNSVNFAKGG